MSDLEKLRDYLVKSGHDPYRWSDERMEEAISDAQYWRGSGVWVSDAVRYLERGVRTGTR